ncbi:YciI family protein [Cytophagaceae bacterium YF14B1]|uniref:YciI family protein n=1 Tax=Xanthocytophaga flava TaxID=3048013 RepID=A0AAE3U974_9BACT|nr:YciI family protein [Xanthocytophaga flavus]MDJ1481953.1 YciI family protein [Xanthocytophaga flavus]
MNEFVLIFRSNGDPHANPSSEQIQERMKWMNTVTAQNKLADSGKRLFGSHATLVESGKKVTAVDDLTTHSYVNGYIVVKTATIEEAIELAKTNPILEMGGSIEVRAVIPPVR